MVNDRSGPRFSLQQHNAFAADLNSSPALRATHDIVEPNHVVASILEARAILFICPTRQRWFLRATNPPDLVFPNCLATGTVQRLRLRLRLLGKKLTFVHGFTPLSPQSRASSCAGDRGFHSADPQKVFFSPERSPGQSYLSCTTLSR